ARRHLRPAAGDQARARCRSARPQFQCLFRSARSLSLQDAHAAAGIECGDRTSTLLAAWNAAIYVAQIDDDRLEAVMADGRYLDHTRDVLQKHGALWFQNESSVVSPSRFG